MRIKLHDKQCDVLDDESRFKVLAAGRRFGKTILACITLLKACLETKEGLYWYVSPTYKQTKQIAWKILLRLIPSAVLSKKPNETELSFQFKNGCELYLKGADNPDNLRGSGLFGLVVDEFASIRNAKAVWEEVLRPSLSDNLGWCLFIGTPKGKNAFWELWMKGIRGEDGYKSWQFSTIDNPHIPEEEIAEAKAQLNERYFRQEYEASFEDFTGLIWPEFDEKRHIVKPFDIPKHWKRIAGIDPAITGTNAVIFAVVDDMDGLVITGEYYKQDVRVSEIVAEIEGRAETYYCDPAAKSLKMVRGTMTFSLFDEFIECGLDPIMAQNDVSAGINRVAEFFKQDRIRIFEGHAPNLEKEITRYHWAEERETVSGIVEPRPYKAMDHACDALRYLAMSRERPNDRVDNKPPDFSERYFDDMVRQQHQDVWEEVGE